MLGAGGSARAVAWALADAGAGRVTVVNRTPGRAVALAEELGVDVDTAPSAGDLVVNCTSVGLGPIEDAQALEALGLGGLEPPAVVVDLVYGDRPTPVERWAAAGGAHFVSGREVLVQPGGPEPGALDRPPATGCDHARGAGLKDAFHETQPFVRAADTPGMAVSRPFVLAVLGVLLAAATFASMRSAAERAQADDTAAAPAVQPAPGTTTTAPAKPKPVKKKPAPVVKGVPPKLAKALQARRTVVLFFRQPAADDDATAAAVASVRGVKGVSVFSAPITKLARYRRVISDLGVTQAPAVVIVGKDRKARLLEGYIDPLTLRQQVKDSR